MSLFGRCHIKLAAERMGSLAKLFCGFVESLQINAWIAL
jgi:hypothetical protein